jgi:hypothetical protein
MTRAVARATFWREIKRSRSKKGKSPPPEIVIQGESDSDTLKAWQDDSISMNAVGTAFQADSHIGGGAKSRC